MAGFTIAATNDTDFSRYASTLAAMKGNSHLKHLYRASATNVTISNGKVTYFNDMVGSSSYGASEANEATLKVGAINGYTSALFAGAQYYQAGDPSYDPNLGSAFSIGILYKPAPFTGNYCLFSSFTAPDTCTIVWSTAAGMISFRYGNTQITVPHDEGTWNFLVASYDGNKIYLSINGGTSVSATPTGSHGLAAIKLGSMSGTDTFYAGELRYLLTWDYDINAQANSQALADVYTHIETVDELIF